MRSAAMICTFCCAIAAQASEIVYDNTATPAWSIYPILGPGEVESREFGNEVRLAGEERLVTRVRTFVRILCCGPATFDLEVKLYANDGPRGEPDTLLWQSGPRPQLLDSGGDFEARFPVPHVEVPDVFTWVMKISNRQGNMSALGPALYGPPTVGTVRDGHWVLERNGFWEFENDGREPFGASIEAEARGCDPCDMNCDGDVNAIDIEPFLALLFEGDMPCNTCTGDVNGDGLIDALDIEPFLECLFS